MKKLTLLDTISLRSTSVYAAPRALATLNRVYGDLTSSTIPCTPIDEDGYIFHISDAPMQLITNVYVDGEPKTFGYKLYQSYQDETGHAIACVIFDDPQYDKKITVSGKGAFDLDTGELIENPSSYMKDVLLNVQGYEAASFSSEELFRFLSECRKSDIKIVSLLNDSKQTVKGLLDMLSANIHSHWHGKAVMQLRNVFGSGQYHFPEEEITDFSITSETLLNEITVNFSYDFGGGNYRASLTKHNPLSKLIYGEAKDTRDLPLIQTTRQAERAADEILRSFSIPQILVSFRHNMKSYRIQVGDTVTVSHSAGLGENGYEAARGMVVSKDMGNQRYTILMEQNSSLYASSLLALTQVGSSTAGGITITYDQGVATITIYAEIEGKPPVRGAEITIAGVKKITDKNGQARFNLKPGKYTAYIKASGYKDAEITFSV